VDLLAKSGAPAALLMERIGLSPAVVHHEEQLIPLELGFRFLAEAAHGQRLPEPGLVAGEVTSFANLGVFGRLVRRARTLGEALTTLFAITASFSSGERWWLAVEDTRALLCHTFSDPAACGHEQADRYGVALAINLLRAVGGPHWTPPEVHFATGPFDWPAAPTGLFRGTHLLFRQPITAIVFSTDFLARPLAAPLPSSGDDLDGWHASGPAPDFAGSIQQVMWSLASENGHPRMRSTATALGVSTRTLQRRLAENGLSFESLLRTERLRMAMRSLERTDARVLDIALDLGYSDHAHFTRAFRRWTGLTPLEYRRLRTAGPPDGAGRSRLPRAPAVPMAPGAADDLYDDRCPARMPTMRAIMIAR
jgi:AraC-like DNA-binding protein